MTVRCAVFRPTMPPRLLLRAADAEHCFEPWWDLAWFFRLAGH